MAMAWQLDISIIALDKSDGWAQTCAGQALDNRRGDVIHQASPGGCDTARQYVLNANQDRVRK